MCALALPKSGGILMPWTNAVLQLHVALWANQAVSIESLQAARGC